MFDKSLRYFVSRQGWGYCPPYIERGGVIPQMGNLAKVLNENPIFSRGDYPLKNKQEDWVRNNPQHVVKAPGVCQGTALTCSVGEQ